MPTLADHMYKRSNLFSRNLLSKLVKFLSSLFQLLSNFLFQLLSNLAKPSCGESPNYLLRKFQIQNPSKVLENGSNPKSKVLQSLSQNFKIIFSPGPQSQIVSPHNSISFIGKGWISPQEIAPRILTHFNFQYFCSALGSLRDISMTMTPHVHHLIRSQDQGFFLGFCDVVKMVIIHKII